MKKIAHWQAAAHTLNREAQLVEVRIPADIDTVLPAIARVRLPALGNPDETDAGGIISYGPDLPKGFHRATIYVDKILKCARPAELPVERPTKLEPVVNLKTAKTPGVANPPAILVRADRVIE